MAISKKTNYKSSLPTVYIEFDALNTILQDILIDIFCTQYTGRFKHSRHKLQIIEMIQAWIVNKS